MFISMVKYAAAVAVALGATSALAGDDKAKALTDIRKVSTVMDANIYDSGDVKSGDVDDLVMGTDGKLHYFVIGTGGVAGVGEAKHALPVKAAKVFVADKEFRLSVPMTKEQLSAAPQLKAKDCMDLTSDTWVKTNSEFYKTEKCEPCDPNKTFKASEIVGATLYGPGEEKLAKVQDILLDSENTAKFAILGKGGVLGIGEETLVIPVAAIRLTRDSDQHLVASVPMNATKLEQAPRINSSDYSALKTDSFADSVCKFYEKTKERD